MKRKNELTKEYLTQLAKDNPIALVEYAWELRKTLDAKIKRHQKEDPSLIAAAPEMLEALQLFYNWQLDNFEGHPIMIKALEAIRKARGES